ncbi:adhesion G protein-coupled receptor F5-like isoform X2 [Ascaphus truei]|uniref:adhesion G protein-coupled receptor F5-like isoform X2 n=1 Tax=Ascaphus truei TaxID=8439 RepID=UPI003F59D920
MCSLLKEVDVETDSVSANSEVKNLTLSPEKPFEGDTLTILCQFNGTVIWSHDSNIISNGSRHTITSSYQNGTVWSTLNITDVNIADAGTYTCKMADHARILQSIPVEIRSINITQTGDVDIVCNGTDVSLTCCSGDSSAFNVTWTVTGSLNITGTETYNSTCHINTFTVREVQCPADKSGYVTLYKCEFKRGYGAYSSKDIKVTYLRIANVVISPSEPVSVGQKFILTCQSDVSNYDNITWKIGNANDYLEERFYRTTFENSMAVSRLTVTSSTIGWNGTYFCTFHQKHLKSTGNVTMEVAPLPPNNAIQVNPVQTVQQCSMEQTLSCCFMIQNPTEEYTVLFVFDTFNKTGEKTENILEKQTCYKTNHTVQCSDKVTEISSFYCTVYNKLKDSTRSNNMTITFWNNNATVEYCPTQDNLPLTPTGESVVIPCQTLKPLEVGNITFSCTKNVWYTMKEDCVSANIENQLLQIQSFQNDPHPGKRLTHFLQDVSGNAKNETGIINNSSKNIEKLVEILTIAANINTTVQPDMMQNVITTVDIIVSQPKTWKNVTNNGASSLLKSVDKFGKNFQQDDEFYGTENNTNNVQFKAKKVNITSNYNENFNLSSLTSKVVIENGSLANSSTIISIAYATMKDILPNGTNGANSTNKVSNGLIISTIVNGDINNARFNISLTFSKNNSTFISPQCVFWNFSLDKWDDTGCTNTSEKDLIICTCNHLTSFSMLMAPPPGDEFLKYITYAGVGISLGSLFIALIIEAIVWKSVTKNRTSYMRHVCLVNIALTLLLADIWLMIGAAFEDHPQSPECVTTVFFSFSFYLSLFFWMLTLGLNLFYRMIYILHDMSKRTMLFLAFALGYGCPLTIAAITVAITAPNKKFTNDKFCWLRYDDSKSILAFVVPALTIVLINFIILLVVICKLLRPSIGERPGKDEKRILIQISKSIAVLTPLLGLTWGVGIALAAAPENLPLHGIFAVLNSLQGLFILIFAVLFDEKVRNALGTKFSWSQWSTQRSKTTSASSSGSGFPKRRKLFGKRGGFNLSTGQMPSNQISTDSYSPLA